MENAGLKLNIQKTKIMAHGAIISRQIDGEKVETVTDFIFLGSKITSDGDCNHEIKTLAPWKKSYDKPKHIKRQRHYFANKGRTVMLEKTLENPLDSKAIKPVNPKGNQP